MRTQKMRRHSVLLLFVIGLAAASCSEEPHAPPRPAPPPSLAEATPAVVLPAKPPGASFVGNSACVRCHPSAFQDWQNSHHDRALDHATPQTVLANFRNTRFSGPSSEVEFTQDGDEFWVRTHGKDGEMQDFQVSYVIGFDPLQQYLISLPGGKLQALDIAWDTERQQWFALDNGQAPPGDWLHWTGGAFNANSMCITCHATDVKTRYDPASHSYDTTWSGIDVGCEACHGPGSAHVTWAETLDTGNPSAPPPDHGLLVALAPATPDHRDHAAQQREIEVCARCHSRRRQIHPDDEIGQPFHDAFVPELLELSLYYPDGQIRDEVYVYGSFAQSRMAAEGVRCSHCHNPHSGRLVAEGNALCETCHDTSYNSPSHTHHNAESAASQCVECHMRPRTYMGIDARRDHGFHIPRPDWTVRAEVPNACNACHSDQSAAWAQTAIEQWYGPVRPKDVHGTEARLAAFANKSDATEQLLNAARDPAAAPIVRASAIQLLGERPGAAIGDGLVQALSDPSPLVRTTAIDSLEGAPPNALQSLLPPLLRDPSRSVRSEAARVLSGLPGIAPENRTDYEKALLEYRAGQEALSDQAGAQLNLAVLAAREGRSGEAETAYREALRLDSLFLPARFNLAMLYEAQGRTQEAEAELRAAVQIAPELADAHYSLGLLLAADPARGEEAAETLGRAATLAPNRARVHYNGGLAQQRLQHWDPAESLLLHALALEPHNPQILQAVTILYLQQERKQDALPHARALLHLQPGNRDAQSLFARASAPALEPPPSSP